MTKILIFGDSQAAGSPGLATERALRDAGYTVRRFGNPGMGPADYVRLSGLWNQYIAAVHDFDPDAILAIFGSNDVANSTLEQAMNRIRNAVRPPVYYSGPPAYPDANANARGAAIRDLAKQVWGDDRYIDAWAWTSGSEGRAGDGLHFTQSGGARWGNPLASELVRRLTGTPLPLPAGHSRGDGGSGPGSGGRRPSARRGRVVVAPAKKPPSEPPTKA